MHMITAAGRKACEQVLDTATEAGLELSPTTISLIAAVIEGAFTGAPRRSGHGLSSLALSIILVIADLVRMIVTAWGGT